MRWCVGTGPLHSSPNRIGHTYFHFFLSRHIRKATPTPAKKMKLLLAFAALMAGVSAKPGTIRKIDSAQGAFAIGFDYDFGSCFALLLPFN